MDGAYIVSARKYRPSTFRSVVGQQTLTQTLKNAIATGRLAQAYLFCGPRGVGKTSCARIFAKTINCLNPGPDGEACGLCESCQAIERGNSFNIIELDAASNNSVDDIRQITDQVHVPPQQGRYRVFIIDEVHMLSSAAFNAFLKTLEEPPKHVIFILATTEKHKVIPTILSRCQIYDFKRITIADMAEHLQYVASQEGVQAEPKALDVIARKADGAMRDALSIFDQVTASSGGNITYRSAIESLNVLDYDYYFRLVEAFTQRDVVSALLIYKEIRDKGFDSLFFVNGLAAHIRDLMVAASPSSVSLLEVSPDVAEQYTRQARSLKVSWYYDAIKLLNRCDLDYRTATDKRLHVELCLINLCRIGEVTAAPVSAAPQGAPQPAAARPAQSAQPQAQQRPQQPQQQAQRPATQQPQQQAQQQPQQVQQQAQQAPRSQAVRPMVQNPGAQRPGAFRLNPATPRQPQTPPAAPKSEPAAPAKAQESDVPLTPQALQSAWQQYIEMNPSKHLLTSIMRTSQPEGQAPSALRVVVESDASRQVLEGEMQQLTSFLRSRLSNSAILLEVVVDASRPRPKLFTPKEFLVQVATDNPVLKNLVKGLDFEFM